MWRFGHFEQDRLVRQFAAVRRLRSCVASKRAISSTYAELPHAKEISAISGGWSQQLLRSLVGLKICSREKIMPINDKQPQGNRVNGAPQFGMIGIVSNSLCPPRLGAGGQAKPSG